MASAMKNEHVPKTRKAIRRAIALLDQTLKEQLNDVEDPLWHAAEETEYASAILSLTQGFTDFDPKFTGQNSLNPDLGGKLTQAKLLLQEADDLLQNDPKLSYEKLRYAVQIIRGIRVKASR